MTRTMAFAATRLSTAFVLFRRLLVGVVFAYAFTSLALGGTSAARWTFYAAVALWSGATVAATFSAGNGPAAKIKSGAVFLRRVELVAVNVALTLVLAEAGLRLVALAGGKSPVLSDTLESYLLAPDKDYGQGLRGNRLGFPGADFVREKRPGVFRVAALGDSFAVGPAVPFARNYLTLLAASQPNTEVYNFGISGTGPREYQVVLQQHVWAFQPDLVLVSVFVGNDITEWLATPRDLDPRQSSLYLLVTRGWRLWRERTRMAEAQAMSEPDRLAGIGLSPQAFLEVEARRLAICLKTPPASMEKKWQRALGCLERIIRDCKQRRAPVAFVLIPDEFQVNSQVLSAALTAAGRQASDVDLSVPQRRLQEFFAARQVPCLDLLPAFRDQPNTYAARDTHWNERGNALAAGCIGAWLAEICRTDCQSVVGLVSDGLAIRPTPSRPAGGRRPRAP
jgi:hypothetical protein